ncbi:MAG TPA: hypothetical protein PLH15_10545 [Spirochaetota bacterium]|nr:hypothetical protein [Spirochaetota bacterium]HQQ24266.1 hypothetical protein [Spirochaetota bacterium]
MNKLFIFIDPLYKIKDLKAFRSVIILLMAFCFVIGHFVIGFIAPTVKEFFTVEEKVIVQSAEK